MFVLHSLYLGIILSLASFALGAEEEKSVAKSELRSPSDSVPSAVLANAPPPPQAVLATQQQKQQQQQHEESAAEEKKSAPLVGGRQPSQFVPLVPFRAGQFVLPRRVNGARAVPFRTSWNIAGGAGTNRGGRGPIIGPDGSLIRPTETEAIALLAGRGGRGGGFFRQPIIGTQNGGGINGNDEKRKQEEEKNKREEERAKGGEKNRKGEEKNREEEEKKKEEETESVLKREQLKKAGKAAEGKREWEEEKNRKEEEERVKGGEEKRKEEETESVLKREQLKKEGKTAEGKRVWEKDSEDSANIGEKGQKEWRKRENEKEKEEREKEGEEKERERKKNGKGREEKEEKEEREEEEGEEKERERKKNEKGREEKEEEKPKGEEELIIEEEQKGATGGKKEDRNRGGQLVVKMSGGKVILEREAEGSAQDKVPTKCEDKAQNCGANSDYCADAYYQELMEFNCAKTCKVCLKDIKNRLKVPPGLKFPAEKEPRETEEKKPAQWTNKCRDLSERCQFWTQHGFCDSRLFHHDLKKRFCAYSCGLCQSSDSDNGKTTRGVVEAVPLTEDGQ
ncbi:hypothetical protein niasHS_012235 [Heterodera schachtii]|uniref:ShKT domain-containing protein n=1 Tax=Heterodera schachtii TaxID=97005 RepID=A0ABD2IBL5_HETSC